MHSLRLALFLSLYFIVLLLILMQWPQGRPWQFGGPRWDFTLATKPPKNRVEQTHYSNSNIVLVTLLLQTNWYHCLIYGTDPDLSKDSQRVCKSGLLQYVGWCHLFSHFGRRNHLSQTVVNVSFLGCNRHYSRGCVLTLPVNRRHSTHLRMSPVPWAAPWVATLLFSLHYSFWVPKVIRVRIPVCVFPTLIWVRTPKGVPPQPTPYPG